jgi:hypothetical protein
VGYIDTATRYIDTSILFDLWQASLPEIFFSKPIRRLEPIERPAEEARSETGIPKREESLPMVKARARSVFIVKDSTGEINAHRMTL